MDEILFEQRLLSAARRFGQEYFDGDRLYGYGGYHYDPKFWTKTATRFMQHYELVDDAEVLEVGCAKGYLLYDMKRQHQSLRVKGIDISEYAVKNAHVGVKDFLEVGDAQCLPYPDNSFDLVISINTVSNLPLEACICSIREIERVARHHSFITVHAWKNDRQKENLMRWNITALSYMHVDDWKRVFQEAGYSGDYYWFLAE